MSNPNIEQAKQSLAEHEASLPAKHSKAEAKAWAKKYNKLSDKLEQLIASDPNRKIRIADGDFESDDEG